jgi:hypothetical protein
MFKSKLPSTYEIDVLYGRLQEASEIRVNLLNGRFGTLEEVVQYLEERDDMLQLERTKLLREHAPLVDAVLVEDGLLPAPHSLSESETTSTADATGPARNLPENTMPLSYTQLTDRMEEVYPQPRSTILAQQETATRRAWAVLDALKDRGGFDDWFYDIDGETQDEIFEKIRHAVQVD